MMQTPSEPVAVFLGLGANLGDREANIRAALDRLATVPGIDSVRMSELLESEPVGGPSGQGRYLNGAAELRTTLAPAVLLGVLKQLERDAGRRLDGPRNGPRPLDLDLLLYGDESIDTRELQVPHPRLHERPFVLTPLQELGARIPEPRVAPQVVTELDELIGCTRGMVEGGCKVGLVPTMGALHEGHASLLRAARAECDRVVATIFVNPLQFAEGEDLSTYPRTLEADLDLARAEGVDLVFAPRPAAMYPEGFCSEISVGAEARGLEGASRPDHFRGVVTVVAKLFVLTRPHAAYFGAKDAQQVAVLRRLVGDLGFDIDLRECPIRRAPDGLALSSRNVGLAPAAREAATVLWRALGAARSAFAGGERSVDRLVAAAEAVLAGEPLAAVDYVALRDPVTLAELSGPVQAGRLLLAVRVGGVRLIDNGDLAAPHVPDSSGLDL